MKIIFKVCFLFLTYSATGQTSELKQVQILSDFEDSAVCYSIRLDTTLWSNPVNDKTYFYEYKKDSATAILAVLSVKIGNGIRDSAENWDQLSDSMKFEYFLKEYERKIKFKEEDDLIINQLKIDYKKRLIISETTEVPYDSPYSRTWQLLFFRNDHIVLWLINNPTLIPIEEFIELRKQLSDFQSCQ